MDRGQSKLALVAPEQRQEYLRALARKQRAAGVVVSGAKPPRRRKAGTPRKCNNVACDKIVTKRNFCYKCQKRKERGRTLETHTPTVQQVVSSSLGPETEVYDEIQAAETRSSVHVGVTAAPLPKELVGEATEISAPTPYNPHRTAWAAPSEWNMPPPPKSSGGMLPSIASFSAPTMQPAMQPVKQQEQAAMEELYVHALSLTNGRAGDAAVMIQKLATKVSHLGFQELPNARHMAPMVSQQHIMAPTLHTYRMDASALSFPHMPSFASMQNSAQLRPLQPSQQFVWASAP